MAVDPVPLALYIRDALRLDCSADELSPPPLIHSPPDRSALLSPRELEEAGREWVAWWRRAVHYDALFHGTRVNGDFLAWYRPFALERAAAVGEPPEFDALAGSPALQRAAIELSAEARSWTQSHGSPDGAPAVGAIAHEIAEEVADRHRVPLLRVSGVILVHATRGHWWRVGDPGVLTCSIACLQSDELAATVIREVFESSLQ